MWNSLFSWNSLECTLSIAIRKKVSNFIFFARFRVLVNYFRLIYNFFRFFVVCEKGRVSLWTRGLVRRPLIGRFCYFCCWKFEDIWDAWLWLVNVFTLVLSIFLFAFSFLFRLGNFDAVFLERSKILYKIDILNDFSIRCILWKRRNIKICKHSIFNE